jgi:hypothetical protein
MRISWLHLYAYAYAPTNRFHRKTTGPSRYDIETAKEARDSSTESDLFNTPSSFWVFKTVPFAQTLNPVNFFIWLTSNSKTIKMKFTALSFGFALTLAFGPSLAFPAASPDAGEWEAPGEGDGTFLINFRNLELV